MHTNDAIFDETFLNLPEDVSLTDMHYFEQIKKAIFQPLIKRYLFSNDVLIAWHYQKNLLQIDKLIKWIERE